MADERKKKLEEIRHRKLQYKKLLELVDVELVFEDDALNAIVDRAIARNTGARGLRSIIEDIMRDIMFDVPSDERITKCIITKDTVDNKAAPKVVIDENKKKSEISIKEKKNEESA